jgi:hypothetical protein
MGQDRPTRDGAGVEPVAQRAYRAGERVRAERQADLAALTFLVGLGAPQLDDQALRRLSTLWRTRFREKTASMCVLSSDHHKCLLTGLSPHLCEKGGEHHVKIAIRKLEKIETTSLSRGCCGCTDC